VTHDNQKMALAPRTKVLGEEYTVTNHVEVTKMAHVYRTTDAIDETFIVTELFDPSIVSRTRDGTITTKGNEWDKQLEKSISDAEQFSRLSHPALEGIMQQSAENGSLYVSSADKNANAATSALKADGSSYQPREVQKIAQTLIELQCYLHDFGVYGIKMVPSAILISDATAAPTLMLRKYIDGTVDYRQVDQTGADDDRVELAITLYQLITGAKPSLDYVALSGNHQKYEAKLLQSIDRCLSNAQNKRFNSSGQWLNFITRGTKSAKQSISFKHLPAAQKATILASLGIIIGCLLLFAGNKFAQQRALAKSLAVEMTASQVSPDWDITFPFEIESSASDNGSSKSIMKRIRDDAAFQSNNPWYSDGTILQAVDGQAPAPDFNFNQVILEQLQSADSSGILVPIASASAKFGAFTVIQSASPEGWILVLSKVRQADLNLFAGDQIVAIDGDKRPVKNIYALREYLNSRLDSADLQTTLSIKTQNNQSAPVVVPMRSFF